MGDCNCVMYLQFSYFPLAWLYCDELDISIENSLCKRFSLVHFQVWICHKWALSLSNDNFTGSWPEMLFDSWPPASFWCLGPQVSSWIWGLSFGFFFDSAAWENYIRTFIGCGLTLLLVPVLCLWTITWEKNLALLLNNVNYDSIIISLYSHQVK